MADTIEQAVSRRRTFAIIAHPDAGKTTLTEKLLLFGGAIQLAGEVKAKKDRMQTRSDWMKIERERGISVVTSVMTFEYDDNVFNLLDTPGHEDFADDTYRTLTAVDAAVMVIDAAKGIEPRTLKLFEVCRLRDIPIITFVNKMDRESRDPFEILDEIEEKLALDTAPITWPIGRGQDLLRHLSPRRQRRARLRRREVERARRSTARIEPRRRPAAGKRARGLHRGSWNWPREACRPFDREAFLRRPSDAGLLRLGAAQFRRARPDRGARRLRARRRATRRPTAARSQATEDKMTAFVFKIQANMDPNHRDRIAFARVCSGKLERGMKAKLVRTGKPMGLSAPQFFFASQRQLADEAYAGDVVGIPNHGTLRIGDTLTEGETPGLPGRAELRAGNPAPRPPRGRDEGQEAEGSAAADGRGGRRAAVPPDDGSPAIVGVVGALQLDVLKERLTAEYTPAGRASRCRASPSAAGSTPRTRPNCDSSSTSHRGDIARDLDGDPVFLAQHGFSLNYEAERWKAIRFDAIKDYQVRDAA